MYFGEQGCICLKAVFAGCCQDAVIWLENWVTPPPSKNLTTHSRLEYPAMFSGIRGGILC